jgi:hypothetical protein
MALATSSRRRSRLRVRDLLLLVPAVLAGVLLLAVCVADRTGTSLSDVLQPTSVGDLVPAALSTDNR